MSRLARLLAVGWLALPAFAQLSDDSAEAVRRLIVMVRGKLGDADVLGAGIIFGASRDRLYIVTANHVVRQGVQEARELRLRFRWLPGKSFDAELLEDFDRTLDVAVLSVRGLAQLSIGEGTLEWTRLGDTSAIKRASAVYSVGHPHGVPWRIGVTPERVSQVSFESILFESYALSPGHSGGGLVDEGGKLIGMIRKDQPPDGEAVRLDPVLDKLREWNYSIGLKRTDTPVSSARPPASRPRVTFPPISSKPPAKPNYIPKLDATVKGMYFYESGKGFPPRASRKYETRFATRGTRYVNWELDLEFPAKKQRIDFKIDSVWYGPNGSVLTRQSTEAYMDAGWTNSQHADGWGSSSGEPFQAGEHRVELFVEGTKIASGTFEIYAGEAPPSNYVQAVDGKVSSPVRFFEAGPDLPPQDKRVYQQRFRQIGTPYIYWELSLTFPKAEKKVDFTIRHVWTKPDGTNEADEKKDSYVEPGWTSWFDVAGRGRVGGGNWQLGTYRVDLYVENRKIASGTFEIVR